MSPTPPAPVLESIRLRAPMWTRVYTVAFGLVWSGVLITAAVRAPHRDLPIAAAMLVFGVLLIASILRVAVTATTDHLIIRNHVTSTTLTRQEIEGFRIGPAPNQGLPLTWCGYALATRGRVIPLTVTARPGFRHPPRHVHHDVDQLKHWLAETATQDPAPHWPRPHRRRPTTKEFGRSLAPMG